MINETHTIQSSPCKNSEAVLAIVLKLGCRLHVAGCDVGHVEYKIEQMCIAYGMEEVEVFIITSSIVVSVKDWNGKHVTMTKRIRKYCTDFYCVQLLERIIDKVCNDTPTEAQIEHWIDSMEYRLQKEHHWKENAGGYLINAVVAAFFTLFFGGTEREAIISFVCCLPATYIVKHYEKKWQNTFAVYVMSSCVCGLLAQVCVNIGLVNSVDKINMGNIMLLIPGLAMVNAIKDLVSGEMLSGLLRLTQAVVQALAVALGFAVCVFWL